MTADNADTADNAAVVRPYIADEQIGFMLRLATQRNSSLFMKHTFDDLTTMQFAALYRLAEMGECSQNELGRRTAMDVATIKGVVDRLRKKGYIATSDDPNDRRRTVLSIAPGHDGLKERLAALGSIVSDITLEPLTEPERRQFLGLLKKLV